MATDKSTTSTEQDPSTADGSGFSAFEKAAMKERAKELRAQAKKDRAAKDGEADVQAKIAEMPPEERELASRFHAVVRECGPELGVRTWYGMPAYTRDGAVLCFFQSATKMGSRYCTIGFGDPANLDEGTLWPTSYAITAWDDATETVLRALVTRAVG
jgi:uncharacterized protein YdhG (YjbR/CyaY superfamily)